jgi:PIN domain nuclease of toxin-antitoxin system
MNQSMNVLLDTHTFLWAISDDRRLGPLSRELITVQASRVLLSHGSLWEIAIKHGLDAAAMPISPAQAIQWSEDSGFELLPIEPRHLITLAQLPQHHSDPFDRLLVAQSVSDSIMVLTADPMVRSYCCLQLDARR